MLAWQDDEETPLLQRLQQPTTRTPLPWDQLWIILFSQLSDPLSSKTLVPFIPQVNIGVTRGDESQVGHYVGILQSSYYAANALTVFYWSRLPDHIGRKPVILTALLAISASMFSFGLSKTLVCCAVCGAFNGSNSVIKSMVMDITDATNMPKAYSYMPIPWMIAAIAGPLTGGSLSRPADRFPAIFGRSELLKTYPYILSCSISMIFVLATWLVMYFRLKEPLPLRVLLTPKVSTATASCVTTGLFHISFNSVLPVFYATPLNLLVFYARLHDHFGGGAIQITGVSSGIPSVILFPVINALARAHGIGLAVWLCVAIQLALTISLTLCFPTNGIAQMFDAGAKIIGPASAALIFSYSMEEGHDAWLVYYILMAIAFLAVGTSLLLRRDLSVWEDHQ
ncbi:MFS multidrug-resistance DHA1 sub-family [Suillus subluteus]|nr:MFS multidrug-resistance DHA1 sub-family [Suillus subluteus]